MFDFFKKNKDKKPDLKLVEEPAAEEKTVAEEEDTTPAEETAPEEETVPEETVAEEDFFEEDQIVEEPERKDPAGYFMEMAQDEDEESKRSVGKTILKTLLGIIGGAAVVYLAVAAFFIGHFYYDTTINGVDFSLKSADDVERYMSRQVDDYKLTIHELQDVTEQIVGADIGIK